MILAIDKGLQPGQLCRLAFLVARKGLGNIALSRDNTKEDRQELRLTVKAQGVKEAKPAAQVAIISAAVVLLREMTRAKAFTAKRR